MSTPPSYPSEEHLRAIREALRTGDWEIALVEVFAQIEKSPDLPTQWRWLGEVLDKAPILQPEHYDLLTDIFSRDVSGLRAEDLALAAYTLAWHRADRIDERSTERRNELRSRLGYHYEDWCWNCHQYVSDAPFDNAGRCDHESFECFVCKYCGRRRHESPFRRA